MLKKGTTSLCYMNSVTVHGVQYIAGVKNYLLQRIHLSYNNGASTINRKNFFERSRKLMHSYVQDTKHLSPSDLHDLNTKKEYVVAIENPLPHMK